MSLLNPKTAEEEQGQAVVCFIIAIAGGILALIGALLLLWRAL